MTEDKTHQFKIDDGHIHQWLNGICTWCGAKDLTPLTVQDLVDETRDFGEDDPRIMVADPDTVVAQNDSVEVSRAFLVAVLTDADIQKYADEGQRVLKWAKTLTITDFTSSKLVAGDLRSIAILKRNVTARIKELLAPMTETLKTMKEDLATILDPINEADKIGRMKITEWDAGQRRIKDAAEHANRKAQEAFDAAKELRDAGEESPDLSTLEIHTVPAAPAMIRPDGGGTVSMVDHWSAEVFDEDLLDRQWMMANQQKLNLEARQRKGERPMAGVKWVNKPTPLVR